MQRLSLVLVAASALILASCTSAADTSSPCGSNVAVDNDPLPAYQGEDLEGNPVDLRADYGTGLVVLNVWASWCGPCRKEAPELVAAATTLASEGVRFLGVDIRDNHAAAEGFVEEFGQPYPSIYDEPARLAADLRVPSPPSTLYVQDGTIYARQLGVTTEETIRCVLDEAPH